MADSQGDLSIGSLSGRTGRNIETIRDCKRIGLIPALPHSASEHRIYSKGYAKRLGFFSVAIVSSAFR